MPPSATRLEATLLGAPELAFDGRPVRPSSTKGFALLLHLCLRDAAVSRAELAELLWSPGRAQNVRQELRQLRRLPGAGTWLAADDPVGVRAGSDVRAFARARAEGRWADAVTLYRGPLLDGFEAPSPAFAEWLEVERRRFEDRFREALHARASELEADGRIDEALAHTRRLLDLDPLDETAHRGAMRLHHGLGDTEAALRAFDRCRRILLEDMGTEPLDETLALRAEILAAHAGTRPAAGAFADALEGDALTVARALALGAGALPLAPLAQVVDLDPRQTTAALDSLARRGTGTAADPADPAWAEVRRETPRSVLLQLHGRLAEAFAGLGAAPEVVAEHLLGADRPAEAHGRLLRAADEAAERLEHDVALTHAFRASWAARDPRQRLEALFRLERAAALHGDGDLRDAALAALRADAFVLQDDTAIVEVDLRRAQRRLEAGEPAAALDLAEEARANAGRIRRGDLEMRAQLLLGGAAFRLGRMESADAAFTAVSESGSPQERLRALNNLGALAGVQGRTRDALAHQERALTAARELGERALAAGILNNLGATADRIGRYEKARTSFEEAARLFDLLGDPRGSATALLNAADIAIKQGGYRLAADEIARAEALNRDVAAPALACRALLLRGLCRQRSGATGEAIRLLEDALERAVTMQDERTAAIVRVNLEITRLGADPARPRDDVTAALARLETLELRDTLPWAYAEIGLLAERPEEILAWRRELAPYEDHPHVRMLALLLDRRAAPRPDADRDRELRALAEELRVAESELVLDSVASRPG